MNHDEFDSLLEAFIERIDSTGRMPRRRWLRNLLKPLAVGAAAQALGGLSPRDAEASCSTNSCATSNLCLVFNTCNQNECLAGNYCEDNVCAIRNECHGGNTNDCSSGGNQCATINSCDTNHSNRNECRHGDSCDAGNECGSNECETNTCTSDDWCQAHNRCFVTDVDCGWCDISCILGNSCDVNS